MTSWIEQAERKYSWRKRSSWPIREEVVRIEHARDGFGRERFGDGADEIAVAELMEGEGIGAPADQRRRVLMVRPPLPITGRSNGTPSSVEGLPGTGSSAPPRIRKEQAK